LCAQCITSGLAMPHNLRKCSALRIRAVVNKFIQAHMDFRYSGDWTASENRPGLHTRVTRWFWSSPSLFNLGNALSHPRL